jgi:hypothetical protein
MYYSKSTGGFYDEAIHGTRKIAATVVGESSISETEVPNPACLIPADAVEITRGQHAALMLAQSQGKAITADANGAPIAADPPPPSPEQLKAMLVVAVQAHLDAQARAMGYDDIKTAATYADEPAVPKFQAEGQALRAWRSKVWAVCIDMLDRVTNGLRAAPTVPELIAALPAFSAVGGHA